MLAPLLAKSKLPPLLTFPNSNAEINYFLASLEG